MTTSWKFSPGRIETLVSLVVFALVGCSPGQISNHCPGGLVIGGVCYLQDCANAECLEDEVCDGDGCVEVACIDVMCADDRVCAGGDCYPQDCEWRNCPGLGEVCVEDECLQVSCVGVECPPGQRCASGNCYPIDCDTKNCPGYGEVCIGGECVERTCVGVDCPAGQRCAGGYCYPSDCSEAGCFGDGEVCIDGICQRRACVGVECQDGFRCANGWCYPEDCDNSPCADPWEVCYQGECLQADCMGVQCPPGTRCSRGECVELDCTQQGQGCAELEICLEGICIPEDCVFVDCPAGLLCAADLECYPQDCPAVACGEYQLCVGGECVDQLCVGVICPAGQVCAAGNCYDADCPSQACGPGEVCENDVCISEECAGGRCCPAASCTMANQCQTEQCQGVTYTCLYNQQAGLTVWSDQGSSCTDADACTLGDECSAGECRGEPVSCDPGETCVLGQCRCGASGPDCAGNEVCCGSGCHDLETSMEHCGMCNSPCDRPHASEACTGGECQLGICDSLFDNCDSLEDNGCETSLETLSDCGACGVACERVNATAGCSGGSCHIELCDPVFGDCDGQDSSGCETPLNTVSDCGACGQACAPAQAAGDCASGSCRIAACLGLWDDCDGQAPNGCETPLDSLGDCGSCGVNCSRPNAVATCAGGVCATAACNPDFFDANGQDADGCECQDAGDAPSGCAMSVDAGTVSASATVVVRSGVIVQRTGYRADEDCYSIAYQRPAPGDGTFRVRLDPDPGNLTMDVWRGDCQTSECDESNVFETRCVSQGTTCQSGNGSDFLVCVHARAGHDSLCQPYTLRFEFVP